MATKLEISELDFDGIKANLKTFLSQQNEFTDYNFEGSGMSVLLDTLAYNTHYLAYNANMLANEMYLDSADLRSSVVSLAKQVGYTPTSCTSSTAVLDVLVNNASGASLTMSRGTKFTTTVDSQSYSFVNNADVSITPTDGVYQFNDIFQGDVTCNKALANEDFIIHRKDNLFAYQLAVVADDISQNISHVVRGCDLLEPTARQLSFYQTLNDSFLKCRAPQYGHVPLVVTNEGYKLSKQNKAPAINNTKPQPALIAALNFLGQSPVAELTHASVEEIIAWAIKHWIPEMISRNRIFELP